jgi:sirohydrochlorin ferrochelatase
MTHVVLVAHGSRDPRSAVTVRALAQAVAAARPDVVVHDAYLDFDAPHLTAVLATLADEHVIVVPLLLSAAYHARTDVPGIVADARARGGSIDIANVLGAPDASSRIIAALLRRLPATRPVDALVLGAAGTRDVDALTAIEALARELGQVAGVPCLAGYASGAGRSVPEAIGALTAAGARSVGLVSYFLAPGILHDRVLAAATDARVAGSEPLGAAPEMVALVSARIDESMFVTA